jgi:cytochrome c oxidase assembly protein subunit 15
MHSAELVAGPAGGAGARPRPVALWLYVVCALIFAMVVLGGITRLTGSGLSMVEWDPLFGIVPPLTEADWQAVFDKYKASPEYRLVNVGMDLAGFKRIFYVEYAHRVLGRAIGLVFLLPFLFFWWRGMLPRGFAPKLAAMFVLGGLQGLLGWYMVQSGLVDDPRVSPYRLAAHFMFAVALYGYILWVALGLWPGRAARGGAPGLRLAALGTLVLVLVTMTAGAFVAGLKAGHAWNTFPLMEGRLVPEGLLALQPAWRNFFENPMTVQFQHRVLGLLTLAAVLGLWMARRRLAGAARRLAHLLAAAGVIQVGLGIATLLLVVPVPLASAHQAGALVVFTVLVVLLSRLAGTGSGAGRN